MKRRTLLSTAPLLAGISGCVNTNSGAKRNGEDSQTDGASNSPSGDDAGPYEYHRGSSLVDVTVHEDFNGDGSLKADCRDEDYGINAGEEFSVDREEDGESCLFQLYINGEEKHEGEVSGHSRLELKVTKEGDTRYSRAEI